MDLTNSKEQKINKTNGLDAAMSICIGSCIDNLKKSVMLQPWLTPILPPFHSQSCLMADIVFMTLRTKQVEPRT